MIIPPVCLIAAIAGVELQRLLRLDRTRLRCAATLSLFPIVFLLNYHRLHIEVPSIQPISLRGLFAELGAKYPNARLVSIRAGTETDIAQNTLMRLFPYLRDRVFTLPNNQSVPHIEPGSDSAPTLYVWTVDCLKADAHLERFDSSSFHIISAKYAPYGPEYLVYVATHDLTKLKPAIEAPW
jgi:hypothetical protein